MKAFRSIIGAWLALVLVAAATPAVAQRTGTRIGRDATSKDGVAVLQMIADCMIRRQPAFTKTWLDMVPGTKAENALLVGMTSDMSFCLDSNQLVMDNKVVRFQPRMLRRPTAVALVRRMEAQMPTVSPLPADADPWFAAKLKALPAGEPVDSVTLGFHDFGHCVAVSDWSGTRALLVSTPGSDEERAAVTRLVPSLGPCLSHSVTLKLTPANLREVVAEPVYHILSAAPVSASAATKR